MSSASAMNMPQPFTPILSNNADDQSLNIGNGEPDTSNEMATLFQQNSQINLVTNSNTQSRQRGGGRTNSSHRISEMAASQPTVQYVQSLPNLREEDSPDHQPRQYAENFSPNFMTMEEYNSSKKKRKHSFTRKGPGRMSQKVEERPRNLRLQRGPTFGQNK